MEAPECDAVDGNEAAGRIAYFLSELIAIYPITPASPMGEWSDQWSAEGRRNLWGAVPRVVEMQSEAGAAGVLHGALSAGALATTFTSSQGLLLMIPDMYKIAGELTPFVMHVAARAVATHALSIFGDHSDVMAARQTGFAMLASSSVQECADMAAISHAATLESRVPFLHFFDGFRTSHEIQKIALVSQEVLRALVSRECLLAHRARGLSPDRPSIRGTAQNPDVFFQSREGSNRYHQMAPSIVEGVMRRFASLTRRAYGLFEYVGHPKADRAVILMGSAAGAAEECVESLNRQGQKVGLLKARLYRPFSAESFLRVLPSSVYALAVLDRTKEPGSLGEPLFLDVLAALSESGRRKVKVIGGRYGLGSKEFTPAMAAAVFAELARPRPKPRFTVGIKDDVSHLSLACDPDFPNEEAGARSAVFFGLGSDGTVGANKTAVKIIARQTGLYVQAYFVYDSKKSGSLTVSHLRFGPRPIRSTFLVQSADFVACHQESFLERYDMLRLAAPGAVFLLNTSSPQKAWDILPLEVQRAILDKGLRFYAIDACAIARQAGLGGRINTVMQAAFFEISGILPGYKDRLKEGASKSYGSKDRGLVEKNIAAIEAASAGLCRVPVPPAPTAARRRAPPVDPRAPRFVREVIGPLIADQGDSLPVSRLPADGRFPVGTARWEKRSIAREIPVWDEGLCIQCNKCALVCPHAAIRVKAYPGEALAAPPEGFKSVPWKGREFAQPCLYSVQVSPEDCTACRLCVAVCPAKNRDASGAKALEMAALDSRTKARESRNFSYFLALPESEPPQPESVKGSQLREPLFEFSGACAGCGETPYLKLLTQLFGDRLLVANATGCSSIFGGNLPTTPWTVNKEGRGPAWSNSLFEDNAEFGLGMRLALDYRRGYAEGLLRSLSGAVDPGLAAELLAADQREAGGIQAQRGRLERLAQALQGMAGPAAQELLSVADGFARKSVWIVGGDGWAYDIGYGGLDHVLRSGANVKVLVLDTEVYSNTGGQASKATPRGAVARFAASGKSLPRKDLALGAVAMGGVYVARVAMGASDVQAVKALAEAEAYEGPALVVAYCHCIAHGYDLCEGLSQQKLAVESGHWPLFRFNPRRSGAPPLALDSRLGGVPLENYLYREARYRSLKETNPELAARLLEDAKADVRRQWKLLEALAGVFTGP
ncbi:MAG: pyruvate:ferredoxin (flavodoxin) oxidoreductase [Elusimicrobia bacterium]|nr:pyruvate:ferredoxin (flavodoxin) oxidoreductase [Elusimicrobiota bacterium]